MNKSLCTKELYCTFLRVTSQRYSALSLSEVSPIELSHDSISRWLSDAHCQPKDIWNEAKLIFLAPQECSLLMTQFWINRGAIILNW